MNNKKWLFPLIAITVFATGFSCGENNNGPDDGGNKDDGPKKVIVVDGGGDVGDFTTTKSMKPSALNPYPYNTLEKLCEEREKKNPQYDVQILKTSSHGDRTILVPQLENSTAPDITYQSGTVINSDLGKGYYVNLSSYLDKPNPYVTDNQKWRDIYNEAELATTEASDGDIYSICLERIPVGIMVNKTMLKKAGINSSPTTFKSFIEACDELKKITASDEVAYSTTYMWYNIALETNMFSDLIKEGDVLRKNGKIDTEELCRLYSKGLWTPDKNISGEAPTFEGNQYYEYLKVCAELGKRKASKSFDAVAGFRSGKLGLLEATGKEIRNIAASKDKMDFEWEIIPYPDLTNESTTNVATPTIRGSAGLATSWFVTNSAEKKGTVEGCVDLLMYLTAPENNNRLIGDLKGGMPLNPTPDYQLVDHIKPLSDVYQQDLALEKEGKRAFRGSVCSWEVLGYAFNTTYIKNMEDVENGAKTVESATIAIANAIKNTVNNKIKTEGRGTSSW